MSEIVFCKTRHVYDSYTDMIRLVELSNFPLIYSDEVDLSKSGVYIFLTMNGDVEAHLRNEVKTNKWRRAHTIQWNIERPSGTAGQEYNGFQTHGGIVDQYAQRQWELIGDRLFDEIWVSDRRLADETGLRFVVLGSDEGLGSPGEDKVYYFCHMSAPVPRRTGIFNKFNPDLIAPNCWPPKRDEVLKQSKFAINVHQDIYPYQEPLRFALFAAYGLPILSESITDSYPFSEEFMIYVTWPRLVKKMTELLDEDYEPYREMGLRARERMTKDFQFGKMVRAAVKESVDRWRD